MAQGKNQHPASALPLAGGEILLFGGSFNPVHLGHMAVIRAALAWKAEEADQPGEGTSPAGVPSAPRLLLIPAGVSPFKQGESALPAGLRLNLLQAAIQGMNGVAICTLELEQPGPSYTIHTLKALAALYPGRALRLILGGDAFAGFSRWKEAAAILDLAGLLLVARPGFHGLGGESPAGAGLGAECARMLPAPWNIRARPSPAGLTGPDGRLVAARLDADPPDVSASRIRREHGLERVPNAAQDLLARYWKDNP